MAATLTNDKTKLKQEIFDLETEEIELDKQILSGTISKEEGRQKKADLAIRLTRLQSTEQIPTNTPEQEDKNHKKNSHGNAPHPHPHPEEEAALEVTSAEVTTPVSKAPPATPFRPSTPNPQVNSLGTAPKNLPATPPTKTFSGKQKIAKGAGKFMMYTSPGGFIVGKTASRMKERQAAKKEVADLANSAVQKPATPLPPVGKNTLPAAKNKPSIAQKAGLGYLKYATPVGWAYLLGKKFPPEKVKAPLEKLSKVSTAPASTQNVPAPTKAGTHASGPAQKSPSSAKKSKTSFINFVTPKTWILLGKKFLPEKVKTPLGKLAPKTHEEVSAPQTEHAPKTAGEYQKTWNKNVISEAISKGYNRSATLQHIRNSKIWQSRAWKYGKYALSPALAGLHDGRSFLNKNKEKNSSEQPPAHSTPHPRPSSNTSAPSGMSPTGLYKKTWSKFGGQPLSRLNSSMGRRLKGRGTNSIQNPGGKAVSKTAGKAGKKITQKIGQQAARQLAQLGGRALFLNPPVLIAVGVIILILIIICAILLMVISQSDDTGAGGGGGSVPVPNQSANPIPGFTITLSSENTQVDQGDLMIYTVNITYSAPDKFSTITVFNDIPTGTEYVTTTGGIAVYDPAINRASWSLSNVDNQDTFSFVLKATQNDILVRNMVYATQAGTSSGGGESTLPTAENCNGAYTLDNPVGNFGDPDCYFAENKEQAMSELYDLLKVEDPTNADNWYLKVIPCESVPPYNPNSHSSSAAIGSPDAAGVWGMYSMGRGKNGQFDRGDVQWKLQTTNAATYGKNLANLGLGLGAYWECWR